MKSRSFRKAKRRRGVTSVEFAFMAPVIFALFMGAIEITRLNFIRNSAANACYEGARKAVTPGSTTTEARDEALRLLSMVRCGNGATATVSSTATSITVSVTVPLNQNSWGLTRFTGGLNITQSCRLSRENLTNTN